MGFKRTSEGRVYFHAPEDGANDDAITSPNSAKNGEATYETAFQPPPFSSAQSSNPQTQMQIIALLKALNERLKTTQNERNEMAKALEDYRKTIDELQKKADLNEKAYKTLEKKLTSGAGGDASHAEILARDALQELEETRQLLLNIQSKAERADKGVAALKKLQVEQAEKIAVSVNHAAVLTKRVKDTEAAQEKISEKVTDTLAQQSRLTRKVEKAMEERTRFLRKLERIEETVLQTRDSLNAKAMVLLTDQGVAAQTHAEAAQAAPIKDVTNAAAEEKAALRLKQLGISAAIVVAGIMGAYAFSTVVNRPAFQASPVAEYQTSAIGELNSSDLRESIAPVGRVRPAETMEWSIEQDSSRFAAPEEATEGATQARIDETADDIGALHLNDQAAVEAALADNPQQVAALLNNIEPGNPTPDNAAAPAGNNTDPAAAEEAESEAVQTASVEPAAGTPAANPVKPPVTKVAPPDIKPDSKLPETIKAIEGQAFGGVPEAQHDLAAIYTAGHGGVERNYERAAYWFEQAAQNGVANAAYNLGVLNHQGLGIEQNLDKAIGWYTRAAELGHPEAQYNLGIAYIEGIGVPYDAAKAAQYFENAANNNIMEAAYNLGLIYENGLLGGAQPDRALFWYKKAADQGSPEAEQALRQLAKSLNISLDEVNALADGIAPQAAKASTQGSVSEGIGRTQAVTAQVQEYLIKAGLYPGPADGVPGPLTSDAIRTYQRKHGLEADGVASQELLSHMLSNDS